jgi:hypothetical protein
MNLSMHLVLKCGTFNKENKTIRKLGRLGYETIIEENEKGQISVNFEWDPILHKLDHHGSTSHLTKGSSAQKF